MFSNRREAGKLLAEALQRWWATSGLPLNSTGLLVVGLPRGGVPLALEIAQKFKCPLDVVVAKKLPFPGQPECAIGAVTSDGVVVVTRYWLFMCLRISARWVNTMPTLIRRPTKK